MAAFERALQGCLEELEPSGQVDLAPLVARALLAGAPSAEADDKCARAGIDAIKDALEF